MNLCPTDATLARLGDDSIAGPSADSLDRHIDECPSCQSKLDRLVKDEAVSEGASSPRLPGLDDPPHIPGFMIEQERAEGPPAWSIRRDRRA